MSVFIEHHGLYSIVHCQCGRQMEVNARDGDIVCGRCECGESWHVVQRERALEGILPEKEMKAPVSFRFGPSYFTDEERKEMMDEIETQIRRARLPSITERQAEEFIKATEAEVRKRKRRRYALLAGLLLLVIYPSKRNG